MGELKFTPGPVKIAHDPSFCGSEDYPWMVILNRGVGPNVRNVICSRMTKEDAEHVVEMWNSFPDHQEKSIEKIVHLNPEDVNRDYNTGHEDHWRGD